MGRLRFAAMALCAAVLAGCAAAPPETGIRRIGAPPSLLSLLRSAPGRPDGVQFVGLEPYDRARDLEVLIFSTRSTAFWGVILPGRWLQLQAPWVQRFAPGTLEHVRPDVASAVSDPKGALAVPLTADGPVVVIRADLWKKFHLEPPRSLAALREAVLRIRASVPDVQTPVVSDLPEDLLFWSLAWSYEGTASPDIYSYPKLYALRFMDEFNLSPAPEGSGAGAEKLLEGTAAVLFTSESRAAELQASARGGAGRIWVGPVPSQSGRALCVYNGWCLASPQGAGEVAGLRGWMMSAPVQARIAADGYLPPERAIPAGPEGSASWALEQTTLCAPPALDDNAREAVRGAILDATEGPVSPEEALRRAQARLQAESPP